MWKKRGELSVDQSTFEGENENSRGHTELWNQVPHRDLHTISFQSFDVAMAVGYADTQSQSTSSFPFPFAGIRIGAHSEPKLLQNGTAHRTCIDRQVSHLARSCFLCSRGEERRIEPLSAKTAEG